MATHTPGRLIIGEDGDLFSVDSGNCVANVVGAAEGNKRARADAARLAVCWNTHADLLSALKEIADDTIGDGDPRKCHQILREIARAALAWAEKDLDKK